MNYVQ